MKRISILLSIMIAAVSCSTANPFLAEWDTPYGIPDFTKIQEKHYIPAIQAGIAQQESEIQAIIDNQDAPTFENVVEAYERSGAILDRVSMVLFNISESDATESLQKIVEEDADIVMMQEYTGVFDNIFQGKFLGLSFIHTHTPSL